MMRFTFWFGSSCDPEWPKQAVASLKNNEWEGPLYLDGKGWSDDVRKQAAADLLEALAENESVTSLVICNANLDQRTMKAFMTCMEKNKRLQRITLRKILFNNEPLAVPAAIFKNHACLSSLTIEGCRLDASSCVELGTLIRESRTLSHLSLSDLEVDQSAFPDVAAALHTCSSLEKMQIKDIHLNEENLNLLLKAAATNSSLSSLMLESMQLRERSALQVANILSRNTHLQELSLRKNNLPAESIKTIVEKGLANNSTLTNLYISYNPIGDEGAKYIVAALQQNSSLKEVCLCNTQLGREGCTTIAQGMSRFRRVKVLNIDGNDLNECGAAFVEGMQSNMDLVQLIERPTRWMRENASPQASAWREVLFYLRLNKGKRRVLTVQHELPISAMPVVLGSVCSDPDMLFHFLRRMPDIVAPSCERRMPKRARQVQTLVREAIELLQEDDITESVQKSTMELTSLSGSGISLTYLLGFGLTKRSSPCA